MTGLDLQPEIELEVLLSCPIACTPCDQAYTDPFASVAEQAGTVQSREEIVEMR